MMQYRFRCVLFRILYPNVYAMSLLMFLLVYIIESTTAMWQSVRFIYNQFGSIRSMHFGRVENEKSTLFALLLLNSKIGG